MERESHPRQQVTTSTVSPASYYEPIDPERHHWFLGGVKPMNVPVSELKVKAWISETRPAFTNPNKEVKE